MTEVTMLPRERPTAIPAAEAASARGDDIFVPTHPLARRARTWTLWIIVIGLLAWSWGPSEMFRAGSLLTDWRNMAEFGSAFLHPNFHDWDQYLADMIVTIQIAIWGTALSAVFGVP